ncbi:KR domain-containing protein [Actinoalloteichus sp. AHMU CJ021]|uniref:3-oxoacyl-[acyl-carrier protein] reductase n=1 Tax=Actinoalloteichus caeruleus DSM 43889 TaxID=1120930 RepID=A0ABT1JI47_ACTCY|nr:SDR family oxidoreductase [Actinoalloteichus caeruleus]AUS77883.1 KR domain-containing protein [Actinoalloteichus sp. AHMU CJ021]MCP2331843.1 3-oxoacyl-[acyl-carrier protein] reductase [Actinoalloteichus caeruleus DSM 43889]
MGALDGRTALVTGGSRGIGRGVVERLAVDGAEVVLSYRSDAAAAADVVDGVRSQGGLAHALRADQARVTEVRLLFEQAEERLGGLDIVVLNAATIRAPIFADATEDDYEHVFDTNVRGPFFAIQEAGRRLRDGGRIVTVSSVNTVVRSPTVALYAGSKAALEQFTVVAAKEFGERGITVNTVSPGATETDMLRQANSAEALGALAASTPLGRLGRPEDIANVVAFLVGPDAAWVTGQNLRAEGGIIP